MESVPHPGSDEAIEQGCTCPIIDNHYGKGIYDDYQHFWVNVNCPLHGKGEW